MTEDPFDWGDEPRWGDLIDPELIHDYVYEGDE